MTFSLVARSADGAAWGVAVASKFLAAGAVVPAARAGQGAVATQSFVNLRYLPDGLGLLAQGRSAADVVAALTAADDAAGVAPARRRRRRRARRGVHRRRVHPVGRQPQRGRATTAQGNCLAGPEVVEAMGAAFLASGEGEPLARRLLAGLRAGDAAGGDRRGRQSAALLVVTDGRRLRRRQRRAGRPARRRPRDPRRRAASGCSACTTSTSARPTRPTCEPLEGELADEVDAALRALGHDGEGALDDRLLDWMGWENYEERHVPGTIDPVVLAKLREAVPAA